MNDRRSGLVDRPHPPTRKERRRTGRERGDSFDRAVAEFSLRYADPNEGDDEALHAAIGSGAIAAERDI